MVASPKVQDKKERLLTGLFADGESAERAYQSCVDRGYQIGEVNIVISEGTRQRLLVGDDEIKAEMAERKTEGGELGGPTGGRVGILVTVLAAVGAAVALPALGLIAGPVAVALTAAGAAGAAAGLIGVIGDWGIPADKIRGYESEIKKGAILIMVEARSDDDARRIADDWKKLGGRDIHSG